MNNTFEFYDARAREAAKAADGSSLVNVRERNLRAEKTWRALADQALAASVRRKNIEIEKAESSAD